MRIDDFLGRLKKVSPTGQNAWQACCPGHEDRTPSLSVSLAADGKILLRCFAGCEFEHIVQSMGLRAADLMPESVAVKGKSNNNKGKSGGAKPRARITDYYDYVDESGGLVYQVCRKSDKSFIQRVPDGAGGWKYGRSRYGVAPIIYRLDKVVRTARSGGVVFVAEGEKDVQTLEGIGLVATCNCGGAGVGKWEDRFSDFFRGCKKVVVLADRDLGPDQVPPGKKCWQGQQHAIAVAESIGRVIGAGNVKALVLPDYKGKVVKDVSDFIAAGADLNDLKKVVRESSPLTPQDYNVAADTKPTNTQTTVSVDADNDLWLEIADKVTAAMMDDGSDARRLSQAEKRKIIAGVVFSWLYARGKFFYHAEEKDHASSMYFYAHNKTLRLLDSDQFCSWLARESRINRTDPMFAHVLAHLHDMALCDDFSAPVVPSKYFCRCGNVVYLSSGDTVMVKVSPGKVEVVDNGTDNVVFRVGQTLNNWTLVGRNKAANPFDVCSLFSNMATTTEGGKTLTLLWMLGVLYGHVTKPPIVFVGGVGSGKTRTGAGIFELLGLPERITSITEQAEDDFWVSLDQGGLVCWDNADTRVRWLPDALAAASTNGSHEKRKKYSDSEVVRHQARAAVIITSSNATFASDAGLADRLLVVRLSRLDVETAESRLSQEIMDNRDACLSWLAYVLCDALADRAPVPSKLNRRHPDWAAMAVRCGRAMGRELEAVDAINGAETDKSLFAVENDFYGSLLLQYLPEGEHVYSATDLCNMIKDREDIDERTARDVSPRKLGRRLDKLWPHIASVFKGSRRLIAGKTEYTLVGLVGFNTQFPETFSNISPMHFSNNTLQNPPNPPKNNNIEIEEEEVILDFD